MLYNRDIDKLIVQKVFEMSQALKFHPKFERLCSHLPKFAIWTLFPPPLLVVVMKSAISRSMHFTLAK